MRHAKQLVLVVGILAALGATHARADVPAAARWFVQIDMAGLVDSEMGRAVLDRQGLAADSPQVARVEHWVGFNPLTDIASVTLFNTRHAEHEGAVVMRGAFDPARIVDRLRLADVYESLRIAGHDAHRVRMTHEGRDRELFLVVREDVIVAASRRALLSDAVGVVGGGAGMDVDAIAPNPDGALVRLGATHLSEVDGDSGLGKAADALGAAFAERDGEAVLIGQLFTTDAEAAAQIAQALQGLKAMVMLREGRDSPAAALLERATVGADGSKVVLRWSHAVDALQPLLDQLERMR